MTKFITLPFEDKTYRDIEKHYLKLIARFELDESEYSIELMMGDMIIDACRPAEEMEEAQNRIRSLFQKYPGISPRQVYEMQFEETEQ